MIKETIEKNAETSPNDREMAVLRENFPSCFRADGTFDIERFQEYLTDKVAISHEGYELKFLGKNYARLLASVDTTTVVVPDEEHNKKPENANSQNIYISGDNLDGLKHLLKSYAHSIKCIYIDPPYNTGSDGFVYNDNFNFTTDELSIKLSIESEQAQRILDLTKRGSASHSAWLTFMYPRLLLARDLLSDDGAIFISIGSDESSNLRLLCDDTFGEENRVGIISRMMKSGGNKGQYFSPNIEYILVYARDIQKLQFFREALTPEIIKTYSYTESKGEKAGKKYSIKGLCQPGLGIRVNQRYWIEAPDGSFLIPKGISFPEVIQDGASIQPTDNDTCWKWTYVRYVEEKKKGNILFQKNTSATALVDENGQTAKWNVFNKIWLDDRLEEGRVPVDLITKWENRVSSEELKELDIPFEFAKPSELIKYLISLMDLKVDDVILDFFSGSATTAHAVMKLDSENQDFRYKFILVQLDEPVKTGSEAEKAGYKTIDQLGMERIIRAAKKIKETHPETTADLGFRHYVLREPSDDTLDRLEKFDPNRLDAAENNFLQEFGLSTVLATWLVQDGYGLTSPYEEVDLAGYKAFWKDKHLYLITHDLTRDAISALVDKYVTDGNFNPENVVLFGYSFTWTQREELKTNLMRLKDTEKNLRINFDVRY